MRKPKNIELIIRLPDNAGLKPHVMSRLRTLHTWGWGIELNSKPPKFKPLSANMFAYRFTQKGNIKLEDRALLCVEGYVSFNDLTDEQKNKAWAEVNKKNQDALNNYNSLAALYNHVVELTGSDKPIVEIKNPEVI